MDQLGTRKMLAYAGLVLLLVAGALSGASIFFQVTAHAGHQHAGLLAWQETFALVFDIIGFVLVFMLAIQAMVGLRLFGVKRTRFRPVHLALAWAVVGLGMLHGAGAAIHSLQGHIEAIPLGLDAIGVIVTLLLAAQIVTGYGNSAAKRLTARLVHGWVVVPIVLIVAGHSVLAVYHTLTG